MADYFHKPAVPWDALATRSVTLQDVNELWQKYEHLVRSRRPLRERFFEGCVTRMQVFLPWCPEIQETNNA